MKGKLKKNPLEGIEKLEETIENKIVRWVLIARAKTYVPEHEAEDLVQDTLIKAIRYKDSYDSTRSPITFLYFIMHGIYINEYKRTKKLGISEVWDAYNEMVQDIFCISSDVYVNYEKSVTRLENCSGLTETEKTTFMHYNKGKSTKEISKLMKVGEDVVYAYIAKVRKKVKKTVYETDNL